MTDPIKSMSIAELRGTQQETVAGVPMTERDAAIIRFACMREELERTNGDSICNGLRQSMQNELTGHL